MAMTRDNIKAIFPDATDQQISDMLNRYHSDIQAERSVADGLRAAAQQAQTVQQANIDLADRFQRLSDELDAQKQSFNNMVAENARLRNKSMAVEAFNAAGISSEQYSKLLDGIVSEDEQKTKDFTANLISVISAASESAKATAKQELLNQTPAPVPGTPPATPELNYQQAFQSGNLMDLIAASDAMVADK